MADYSSTNRFEPDPLMIEIDLDSLPPSKRGEYLDRLARNSGPGGWMKLPAGLLDRLRKQYGYPDDMPAASKGLILHPTESNAARAARGQSQNGSMPTRPAPAAGGSKPGFMSRMKKRLGGKSMGPFTAGIVGSVATAPLFLLMDRIMNGSMEDQMRKQMDISRKLDMEMGGGAGMGMMGGMPVQDRDMYDLITDKKYTRDMNQLASLTNAIRGTRSRGGDELAALLAGSEARMRDMQSPRQLTTAEIMSILGG